MNISDNKITEALEAEVEKDISLLFPFIENEVNELALDALRVGMGQTNCSAHLAELDLLFNKLDSAYRAALSEYIEKHFDRKEAELQKEALQQVADAKADAAQEDRYDCAIHGRQDGPDCPRC